MNKESGAEAAGVFQGEELREGGAAVGLVLCGYRNRAHCGMGVSRQAATGTFGKVTGRLMGWFSDFF